MSALHSELQDVFRRVFDDDALTITDATAAADIDGWDSMAHINLIIAIEKHFGVKFAGGEIAALGRRGQTVADILEMLESKMGRASG